ncbi:OmpA family protein [Fibrella sp. WM1]|uniref:OmpA family protein n=1 Tax=Fibrella musci TaxID=3242485 RepID=UPI0035227DD3
MVVKWSYIVLFLALSAATGYAQTVQWATQVTGYSTERVSRFGDQQYRASQALGKPNVLPQVVESPCAWSPIGPESTQDEWIKVSVDQAKPIRQVIVAESANPGAITQVIVFDEQGKERVIFSEEEANARLANTPVNPLLRIQVPEGVLTGREIKVVMKPSRVKGINQIDAIGVSDNPQPVTIGIRLGANAPKVQARENLGPGINSPSDEVAPVISPDGKTIYFTRTNHKGNVGRPDKQDVWFSTLNPDRTWSEAQNIGKPINTDNNNAINGISPDGRTLYLLNVYRPDGSLEFGISKSTLTKSGWTFPRECQIANYAIRDPTRNTFLELTVSPDGQTMLLALERKDAIGKRDLYVSFRQADVTWSEPKSLGPVLNTADEEAAPFLAIDNRTLYFTSQGHPGYGNGDIFVTRRLDDTWTNWSEPENLGLGINSPEWDGYFNVPASGEYAYLSSRANSLGEHDLFRLKLVPGLRPEPVAMITGQVLDMISKKPVATEVVSELLDSTSLTKVDYDPETGEYKLFLPIQKAYKLTARKDGYFPISELIDLSRDKRFRDIKRNLYVLPIQVGSKTILRGILFAQSQSELLAGSETELDALMGLLQQYPAMEILVEGHTDNQGDWEPNMKLSEDRVKRVKQYLIDKGIAEARIQTKAWGPSKPIASNETEEKRKLNRRVEFTILKL